MKTFSCSHVHFCVCQAYPVTEGMMYNQIHMISPNQYPLLIFFCCCYLFLPTFTCHSLSTDFHPSALQNQVLCTHVGVHLPLMWESGCASAKPRGAGQGYVDEEQSQPGICRVRAANPGHILGSVLILLME